MAVVKNTGEGKIGKPSYFVGFDYVNRFAYPLFSRLWKAPVEKAVENVEKCGFSTGIPVFFTARPTVERLRRPMHKASFSGLSACYVNGYPNRFLG